MAFPVSTSQGRTPLARAARRIQFLTMAISKDKALRLKSFAAVRAVGRVQFPSVDRQYIENHLGASAVYAVENAGYHGYSPGAALWHLRQALSRLLSTAVA